MINQVTLVGRLTKDPELRVTTEGTPVTHVTLAVNRHFKNHNGQIEADFVQCTLWRKTAENTAHYCRKGSVIGITGRIHTRNYDNSEGKKVYVTEVVAETVQFLGKKATESESKPVAPTVATTSMKPVVGVSNEQQASAAEAGSESHEQATIPVPF